MHVRKNAASMSANEINKFMNAILGLKKKPAITETGTPTNVYDQFVAIHEGVMDRTGAAIGNGAHRGPAFCAWHREYILRFEQQLQTIDPDVFLPYWSWESGNASDTNSIFVNGFMGPREKITSGYLSETPNSFNPDGWRVDPGLDGNGSGTRLTRNSFTSNDLTKIAADGRKSLGKFTFIGSIGFRRTLESAHDRIHVTIGGHMSAMTSPNDPIFFLHHANVDRLWAKWQLTNPGDLNYPSTFGRGGHALNDLMWPWDGGKSQTNRIIAIPFLPPVNPTDLRKPKDVLDIETLDYTYDDIAGSSAETTSGSGQNNESKQNNNGGRCFIATAAYGSELEPPVQFLREFRDEVILQNRCKKGFESILNVYYKFSPPIADQMRKNKTFKIFMKYSIVFPFVILARITAFLLSPFTKKNGDFRK